MASSPLVLPANYLRPPSRTVTTDLNCGRLYRQVCPWEGRGVTPEAPHSHNCSTWQISLPDVCNRPEQDGLSFERISDGLK